MSRQRSQHNIVFDGEERIRRAREKEIREELLRRSQSKLEDSGVIETWLLRAKILLRASRMARRTSGGSWYLGS